MGPGMPESAKSWQISSFYLALYLALLSASRPTNINKKLDSLLRLVTSMQKEKRMKRIELLWTHCGKVVLRTIVNVLDVIVSVTTCR